MSPQAGRSTEACMCMVTVGQLFAYQCNMGGAAGRARVSTPYCSHPALSGTLATSPVDTLLSCLGWMVILKWFWNTCCWLTCNTKILRAVVDVPSAVTFRIVDSRENTLWLTLLKVLFHINHMYMGSRGHVKMVLVFDNLGWEVAGTTAKNVKNKSTNTFHCIMVTKPSRPGQKELKWTSWQHKIRPNYLWNTSSILTLVN